MALVAGLDEPLSISTLDVPDEDWARRSQTSLRAIRIGALVIAPPWDIPNPPAVPDGRTQPQNPTAEPIVIVIEPSTGFGTGHHATTRLCLRALQRVSLEGRAIIDVGTGSGVLAIAAARLGAASVIAFDDDPDAIAAARANLTRNFPTGDGPIEVRVGRLEDAGGLRGDVVLANLTGAVLQAHVVSLTRLARRGTLIVSGVLVEEAESVRSAFASLTSSLTRQDEDGWTAFAMAVR
jgi:ribosomal protein L11 methyltransferase